MAKLTSLGKWRDGKDWTQADLADKLDVPRPTFQKMESGVGPLPPKIQTKLRKLGYEGPWPREEAAAEASPSALHREVWKLEGRLENVEKRLEEALTLIRDLKLKGP